MGEGSSGPRVFGWGAGLAAPIGGVVAQRSTLRCAVVACQCQLCVCVCVCVCARECVCVCVCVCVMCAHAEVHTLPL